MPNTLSRTRRAVVGWLLILVGLLIPLAIGFVNPGARGVEQRIHLLFAYDWLYGLAVLAIVLGLVLQAD